ncbi:MAG: methylenetetrahydrofolate reductase, partial [Pseudomonadota bacterium]
MTLPTNHPGSPLPDLEGHVSGGRFERVLRAGHFAVTAELAPPDSALAEDVYDRARVFDGYVDGMNATDGSGAHCHMSSVAMCALLTGVGYSPVLQISCRDKNRIAIQGDVLGAAAMGVSNVLCLSGDGVQVGDHPEAKPVFDLDSMSLLETIRTMRDESRFLSGREITSPPRMFLGGAENPSAPPIDFRPYRLAKKIAAGAQFIQTQYVFDIPQMRDFMAKARDLGLLERVFILPGVGPLASARTALWIRNNVPGINIPDAIIKRLEGAENPKQEGRQICIELIQQLREIEGVSGVHVMAYRQEEAVAEIIQQSGVLEGRVPWYPGCDEQLLNYKDQDLKEQLKALTGGKGADVIYDCVGGPYSEPALRATAWEGRFLVIGFAAGEIPKIPLNLL